MPASHARPHPSTQLGRPRLHLRRKKAVELSEVLLREVQVESPRSLLPSDGDLAPGGMGRSHFGDQEHVVAATIQRVADQLLGRAVAVHLPSRPGSCRDRGRAGAPPLRHPSARNPRPGLWSPARAPESTRRVEARASGWSWPTCGLLSLEATRGLRLGPSHRESAFTRAEGGPDEAAWTNFGARAGPSQYRALRRGRLASWSRYLSS